VTTCVEPVPYSVEWYKLHGCTCTYAWKSYGRLYGISMGKGWVRMNDDDVCPLHTRKRR
jgi:hypothetical protein